MGVAAGGGAKGSSLTPMSTPHLAPVDCFSESTVSFSLLSRCRSALSLRCLLGLCPLLAFSAFPPRHTSLLLFGCSTFRMQVWVLELLAMLLVLCFFLRLCLGLLLRSLTGFSCWFNVRRMPLKYVSGVPLKYLLFWVFSPLLPLCPGARSGTLQLFKAISSYFVAYCCKGRVAVCWVLRFPDVEL